MFLSDGYHSGRTNLAGNTNKLAQGAGMSMPAFSQ